MSRVDKQEILSTLTSLKICQVRSAGTEEIKGALVWISTSSESCSPPPLPSRDVQPETHNPSLPSLLRQWFRQAPLPLRPIQSFLAPLDSQRPTVPVYLPLHPPTSRRPSSICPGSGPCTPAGSPVSGHIRPSVISCPRASQAVPVPFGEVNLDKEVLPIWVTSRRGRRC